MRKRIEVPEEPGTEHIPSNHIRLFHYLSKKGSFSNATGEEIVNSVRKNGLLTKHSRDEAGNARPGWPIWASANINSYKNQPLTFVEFSIDMNDPSIRLAGMSRIDPSLGASHYATDHILILRDVSPDEFIAIHEPWHHTYQYLVKENMVEEVLRGDFDHLLDGKSPNEAKAIMTIKQNFGNDQT